MIKRLLVPFWLLAAACGDGGNRPGCEESGDCPSGQYCDHTPDGNVCWPDTSPPSVSSVAVSCSTNPCLRDARLTVTAQVSDDHILASAMVSIDLAGHGQSVPMSDAGNGWLAELSLEELPFPAFEGTVTARVTAKDDAGHETAVEANPLTVTRLAWSVRLETAGDLLPTAPAVAADGTVVVAADNHMLYFLTPAGARRRDPVAVGTSPILQAPSIGTSAIWVAGGTRVFAVKHDGSGILNGQGYDTLGAIVGPPGLSTGEGQDIAFLATSAGRVWAVTIATPDGFAPKTGAHDPFTCGPLLDGASVFAISRGTAAVLRHFSYDDGAFVPQPPAEVGSAATAPIAADAQGNVWTGSSDTANTELRLTTPQGSSARSIPLDASVGGSVVVLADGDVAVSEWDVLRRFAPDGTSRWAAPPRLAGIGLTPLVLAGGDAQLVVPTGAGTIHAVSATGAELWRATLAPEQELREASIAARGAGTSTAYLTSRDGKLHAVIVDGALDAAAPWPKAFHDPQNTSNAGSGL